MPRFLQIKIVKKIILIISNLIKKFIFHFLGEKSFNNYDNNTREICYNNNSNYNHNINNINNIRAVYSNNNNKFLKENQNKKNKINISNSIITSKIRPR